MKNGQLILNSLILFNILMLNQPLDAQTMTTTLSESKNTIYCFPNFKVVDSLYYSQPDYERLCEMTVVAPRIKSESIESIKNSSILSCFSPTNSLLLSKNIVNMQIHVFLNENAELQAVGVSFYCSKITNIIQLTDNEFKCLNGFLKTLKFEYRIKPSGSFICKVFWNFKLKPQ